MKFDLVIFSCDNFVLDINIHHFYLVIFLISFELAACHDIENQWNEVEPNYGFFARHSKVG